MKHAFLVPLFLSSALSITSCTSTPPRTIYPPSTDASGTMLQPDLVYVDPFGTDDMNAQDSGPDPTLACQGRTPCTDTKFGPGTFPVAGAYNEVDNGVGPNMDGDLALTSSSTTFHNIWVANTMDWNRGTISKLDINTVRETARYLTVTCYSNPGGNKTACDGTKGCCSADDYQRYQFRVTHQGALPPHQAIDPADDMPSRTAMDYNGDVFVSNRNFNGQSSVTKFANDVKNCKDYNNNGKIDTSYDANGDGVIQTDCNANGVIDDLDDIKALPCKLGAKQEFFGLDDECILWTTNTNVPMVRGRPLTLGPGSIPGGPSDAWAGSWKDGQFFRLDGQTGLTKTGAQGPKLAYGATTDTNGIVWIAVTDCCDQGKLGFFDTANPLNSGVTRGTSLQGITLNAYGIAIDRDQNIWQGGWTSGSAYRYTPDRSGGVNNNNKLGAGTWTVVQNPGANSGAVGYGRGIAVDSRVDGGAYFAWMALDGTGGNGNIPPGYITRIDVSLIPKAGNFDILYDGSKFPAVQVAGGNTVGVGVDTSQNIWATSNVGAVVTRIKVDAAGNMSKPDITSAALNGTKNPAGDRILLKDNANSDPQPYTYSDYTGFGLRNFTNPAGSYSVVIPGCPNSSQDPSMWSVDWHTINLVADVPPTTTLSIHARSGPSPTGPWGAWTNPSSTSPIDLYNQVATQLSPNGSGDGYLQIEFLFTSAGKTATPRIMSFDVGAVCSTIG